MDCLNPFEDDNLAEAEDKTLISRAQAGGKTALEQRLVAKQPADVIDDLDSAYSEIQRAHPFHNLPDYVAALRNLLDHKFKHALDPN